jgi:hypothetical protein
MDYKNIISTSHHISQSFLIIVGNKLPASIFCSIRDRNLMPNKLVNITQIVLEEAGTVKAVIQEYKVSFYFTFPFISKFIKLKINRRDECLRK